MRIIPLKEGNFAASRTKEFSILKDCEEVGYIKMGIQSFLIIIEDDYILLDAGLGWIGTDGHRIIDKILQSENITTAQISKVLLSHLHKDHINGTMTKTDHGYINNYPNAQIYIQRRELEFAMQNKENPSFDFELLEALIKEPNIVWMDHDIGSINEKISFEVVGGHTPFHQVFCIKENNQTVFFGGDNLPQSSYLRFPIAFKTDYDGKKAKEKRTEWERKAHDEHWTILFYHDLNKSIIEF